MKLKLPQLLWFGNTNMEIELPDIWDVEYCPMHGAKYPPLNVEQLKETLRKPIGSPILSDLARGKETATIIFDDMTRPTRAYELVPLVIEELLKGGIREEKITFVCALGAHGALTQNEFRKKLGSKIVERFRVFNHNIYENCVNVGTTSLGTSLMINREVIEADIKVAIGCVTAHSQAGFSGGGKLLLPGVAHIDSITHYHVDVEAKGRNTTGPGKFKNNILRRDIEEAAAMVGLDYMLNALVNERGETCAVFAGQLSQAYEKAVQHAKNIYATQPRPEKKNLVIANAFVKANEMAVALRLSASALQNYSGTVVIIANSPDGQVVHYLLSRFGASFGGRQYPIGFIPSSIEVIIMAPYLDRTFGDWFENPEVITWTRSWEQTMELLEKKFSAGTKVAVLPTATMQYFAD